MLPSILFFSDTSQWIETATFICNLLCHVSFQINEWLSSVNAAILHECLSKYQSHPSHMGANHCFSYKSLGYLRLWIYILNKCLSRMMHALSLWKESLILDYYLSSFNKHSEMIYVVFASVLERKWEGKVELAAPQFYTI